MRINFLPLLLFLITLITPACVSSTAQVAPAVAGATQLRILFEHEQATVHALVAASNPQPATLQAFTQAQAETKQAFDSVFQAHLGHLQSLSGVSTEVLEQLVKSAIATYQQVRR